MFVISYRDNWYLYGKFVFSLYIRTVWNHPPAYIVKIKNKVQTWKAVYIICILNHNLI